MILVHELIVLCWGRIPASIYSKVLTGQPSAVTMSIGRGLFAITNIIFVFESLSTLDSTFTSAAKLLGPEFAGLLEDGHPKPPQTAKIWWALLTSPFPCPLRPSSAITGSHYFM